jgi:signal peptidase II
MMDASNDTFLAASNSSRSHDSTSPRRSEPADDHGFRDEALTAVPLGTRRLELWLPLLIIALDQITKAIVRSTVPLYSSVPILPGFLSVTHLRNSGAAFGFLNAAEFPFKTSVIAVVATAALIAVGWYAARLAHHQLIARIGLALIIGGAAGNLLDRILVGSVLDFVDVYWRTYHFWAFNVADSAITIGVVIMFLDMMGVGTDVSEAV